MLAGTGNGKHIQQFEVAVIQTVKQQVDVSVGSFCPIGKLPLSQLHHMGDVINSFVFKNSIFSFGNKRYLILEVVHAIIYRSCRKHQ